MSDSDPELNPHEVLAAREAELRLHVKGLTAESPENVETQQSKILEWGRKVYWDEDVDLIFTGYAKVAVDDGGWDTQHLLESRVRIAAVNPEAFTLDILDPHDYPMATALAPVENNEGLQLEWREVLAAEQTIASDPEEDERQLFEEAVGQSVGEAAVDGFAPEQHAQLFTNYETLAHEGPRIGFVERIIKLDYDVPNAHTLDMAIADIRGYVNYLADRLAVVYEDDDDGVEAYRTANQSAWEMIQRTAHTADLLPGKRLHTWHQIDAYMQQIHQVDKKRSPDQHPEPFVASFYATFWQHLDMPQPGDRSGGWDVS